MGEVGSNNVGPVSELVHSFHSIDSQRAFEKLSDSPHQNHCDGADTVCVVLWVRFVSSTVAE